MRPQARPIEFQSYGTKEVVNYSAIANKAKQLSDNIRTVAFDQVNDSITFKSSLIHDKPPVSIKPSDNSINNVSSINCTDGSTITGITSDSSNTDPTKAISANILTDLNTRFKALESKTQNQTATENETTFTGNVTANTFNGFHLGMDNKFYKLPAIPIVRDDLVMEVGRYIDFHYNGATNKDYTSRLSITKPGTLYYDHSFIANGGDIKARNCIADGGNLNDIASRTKSIETKNTEQDTRLDNLESKDIAHEERIGSIEAMDTAQNETINNINTKNDEQDTRLDNIETKNTEQDERLDDLEKYKLSVTYKAGSVTPNITHEFAPELSEERTDVFNIKINITFEEKTYFPTFAAGSNKLLYFEIKFYEIINGTQYTVVAGNTVSAINENGNVILSGDNTHYTVNNFIIEKGKISLDMSYKSPNHTDPSMWHGWFSTESTKYYQNAVLSQPTINEFFISKNLAHDNEDRLTAATNKNTEQDTRLSSCETDISNLKLADANLHEESVRYYDYSREHIEEIENTKIPAINTKNTEQDERISSLESVVSNLLNSIYPVGSIYLSLTKSPPSLGGTWELIDEGKFLYSTTSTSGETGGSLHHTHKTSGHVLTVGEMPKHKHDFNGNKITGTVYDIMKYDSGGQTNKNPEGAFSVNRYGNRTWDGIDGSNRAFSLTFTATPTGSITFEGNNKAHNHGNTEAEYHIPPYITCFMYKRTA